MSKMVAKVGFNVGKHRVEEGEEFDSRIFNERQLRDFADAGYAVPLEQAEAPPPKVPEKEA